MRTAGIIAEYNPFHNGHAWQIRALRAMGFDAVVCVCSPSVVQRGTPALYPTAVRTRAALAGGADVVLSLPAPYAAAPAQAFARAGVWLLSAFFACDALAFGTEGADAAQLSAVAEALSGDAFAKALQQELCGGVMFAAARARAAERILPGSAALLRTPNNALAVEYLSALAWVKRHVPGAKQLQPVAVARVGALHDAPLPLGTKAVRGRIEPKTLCKERPAAWEQARRVPPHVPGTLPLKEALPKDASGAAPQVASATALRALAEQGGAAALGAYVPAACLPFYLEAEQAGKTACATLFSTAVLSRLRAESVAEFARVRGVNEGLENRLAAAVRRAGTLEELYDAMKTKRYSHARLRRLALDAALGYTAALPAVPPYLHVLGATPTGQRLLQTARAGALVPMSHSLAQLRRAGRAGRRGAPSFIF